MKGQKRLNTVLDTSDRLRDESHGRGTNSDRTSKRIRTNISHGSIAELSHDVAQELWMDRSGDSARDTRASRGLYSASFHDTRSFTIALNEAGDDGWAQVL